MLTFETSAVQGVSGIIEKLTVRLASSESHIQPLTGIQTLPFTQIKHQVSTIDSQPSNEAGGILVMVTGALLVSDILDFPPLR